MEVTELLAFTMQSKGSDLHLPSGNPPLIRISGDLRPLKMDALTGDDVKAMLYSIMTEEQRAAYEDEKDLDFAIAFAGAGRPFHGHGMTLPRGWSVTTRARPRRLPGRGLDKIVSKHSQ